MKAYRDTVRAEVDEKIRTMPLTMPINWENPFWVILMGIEHQRIHIETSSVIIRRLPIEMVRQLPLWTICTETGEAPRNELLPVAGGRVVLGKSKEHPLYGWDNEFGRQETDVWDFLASRYLVSNQEYLSFVEDRAYEQQELWTAGGLEMGRFFPGQASAVLGGIGGRLPVPDHGADHRHALGLAGRGELPGGQGFLQLAGTPDRKTHSPADRGRVVPAARSARHPGPALLGEAPGNINLEHWASSCPVNQFRFGEFFDIIGNVWQWTETPITGFDGFAIHPYYDDFSTPTFDTQHNLIKGGSWISTGNEATRDSRYAFRRHFFQHAGLRYVQSDQPLVMPEAMYETDAAVSQYCEFHYGKAYFGVANFPARCAEVCCRHTQGQSRRHALDLGCAVGRAAFELAKEFDRVTGIDFSARFIRIALQLKEKGVAHYELVEEGEVVSYHEARLSELGLDQVADRVEFFQGDATNLKPQFTGYDLILAANLIDRLNDPREFLETVHERLNPGGVLVITSPYTWLEEFTKKENWLGGIRKAGEPYLTLDALRDLLSSHFVMLDEPREMEFVIRETRRKFQHTVAELTVWKRVR